MDRVLTGVALISCLAACADRPAAEQAARHVVVISMDTARADHFGFLGNENRYTPRLDELAGESITLTDYLTVAPTTLASHTSLFTGRYPHHHGTPRNGFMVHRENEMLAELLKRIGFHTAGFAASFALSDRFDFAQGFDHYDERFDVLIGQPGVDQNQRSAADTTIACFCSYTTSTRINPTRHPLRSTGSTTRSEATICRRSEPFERLPRR
jgi:hypothetical protein